MPSAILKKIPSRAMAYPTRAPLNTEEFMEPSAEITIAHVIHAAAPYPAIRATTSEAMWSDEATLENGNTSDASDKCARKILLRVFDFGPDQIQILPTVVGPERGCERGEKRSQNRAHSQARVRPERIGRARGRGGGEKG